MPNEQVPGKPRTRRYSQEDKDAAVRMVHRSWGPRRGRSSGFAEQLGYGVESVPIWVKQADIDEGHAPGVSTTEAARIKDLEQENRKLRRANEILKRGGCRTDVGSLGRPDGVTPRLRRRVGPQAIR
jgi:transposase